MASVKSIILQISSMYFFLPDSPQNSIHGYSAGSLLTYMIPLYVHAVFYISSDASARLSHFSYRSSNSLLMPSCSWDSSAHCCGSVAISGLDKS